MPILDDIYHMNIDHISVSRTGTWEECKAKYTFRYHLKTPSPVPAQPYFTYGKLIHRIIEEYTLGKGKVDINQIKKQCLNGDILLEEGSNIIPKKVLPQIYLNRLPSHLEAFMKLTNKIGTDGDVEWMFKHDLDPGKNKNVVGVIDRLIKKDGKFIIIDYKTTKKGSYRKTKRNVMYDLQLQCYALVVMKQLNVDPKDIFAALYYLEGEEFLGATFSEKTLLQTEQSLLKTYNEIYNLQPEKAIGRVGYHCDRCDYKSICPFYSLTH